MEAEGSRGCARSVGVRRREDQRKNEEEERRRRGKNKEEEKGKKCRNFFFLKKKNLFYYSGDFGKKKKKHLLSRHAKVEFGAFWVVPTLYFETWSNVRFKIKFLGIRFRNGMLRYFKIRCFGKLLLEGRDETLRNSYNRTREKSLMKMICQMQ